MSKDKDSNNIQQESQKETDKVNLDKDDLEYIEEENKKKKKVELDLDDAPFLEQEEPEEEEKEKTAPPSSQEEKNLEQDTPPPKKKKWILIGIIALLLILIGGGYFLFFNKTAPPPPPAPVKPPPKKTKNSPPPPEEKIIPLKQFLVELKNKKKQPLFLEIKLSFATTNGRLEWEIKRKRIVLRDAIYYYLTNKEYNFLANTKNIPKLKQDILNVVNQYLNNGQLKKVLIEHYVIS
ncbi:flagellar basal body-associated FliL family protein [Desulfonauticus submarinus]